MNKPAYIMQDNSITVFVDGKPHTINNTHINFADLRKAILNADYDAIPSLVSVTSRIQNASFGNLTVKNGEVFYKNHQLHGVVVEKLLAMLSQGAKDVQSLINFIDRLMANPSANSVNELYSFLSYKSLPITADGKFLAYKGVDNTFYSKQGNKDTLVVSGKVAENGSIYNGVGETIEVARRSVDDNKDNHCSFGLHVGSYDYANNWAGNNGRLLVVEVDPADAVSVPTDCSFQKLRVSKYKVISDITPERKEIPSAVYNDAEDTDSIDPTIKDSSSDCDFCDNPENCDFCDPVPTNVLLLKMTNYIENFFEDNGHYPTVKQIQSRMKDYDLSCDQIFHMLRDDDYIFECSDDNGALPISQYFITGRENNF